jgi:glycosyltransferase involved in cell wall biosynthesis
MSSLVSVIIPCFNADRFLVETIESVLKQTYRNVELIVVDDGSSDNSRDIIESFGARVKADFGPNRGPSAARNRGTQLASGDFIQYLDADDLLAPDALSGRLEALRVSNADVAYSDWQPLMQAESGFEPASAVCRTIQSVNPDPQVAILTSFWCPPAAILYSRRIVTRIGRWNETLPILQDARFLFDAALHNARFAHAPGVTAFYRIHNRNISRRNQRTFLIDCLENAIQVYGLWRESDLLTDARRDAALDVISYVARVSFEVDRQLFIRAIHTGKAIKPDWMPRGTTPYRLLSSTIGFAGAEQCASLFRRVKAFVSLGAVHPTASRDGDRNAIESCASSRIT